MDLDTKLAQLKEIYRHHDLFFAQRNVACHQFCAACCTCNVTLTSLEGYLIASTLNASSQWDQMPAIQRTLERRRFQPQVTINGLAALCMQDEPVPEEACDPRWGTCPFLVQDACTIYNVRPFGCRAMMSVSDCRQTGYADMDELALTVNNVFLQAIEHLDHTGLSGNLSDMIDYFMAMAGLGE